MRYAYVGADFDCNNGLVYYISRRSRWKLHKLNAGGMSIIVASIIARIRGTGQPELSIKCAVDLDRFLRECNAYVIEHGAEYSTPQNDRRIGELRQKFEEILESINGYMFD